ncbi:MAG: hypothetical protein GY953_17810, partial [bacterium]|nr:hypothetical protein [bacterium]
IRALPGVESAGMISRLPFGIQPQPFTIVGRPAPAPGEEPRADFNEIVPGLFETLDTPLLRGRYLNDKDMEGAAWVAVINRTMAERYFPDGDPIGQTIQLSMRSTVADINVREQSTREIVGVVGNFKYPSFYEEPPAAMYVPHWQHPSEYGSADHWAHIRKTLVVRTSVEPMSLAEPVRRVIAQVNPDQAAHDLMTMEQRIASSVSVVQTRFLAQLFGIFGGLAILLAVVGIYGVTSYYVSQRTHEFGIRMAIGAGNRDVIKLVLRRVLK